MELMSVVNALSEKLKLEIKEIKNFFVEFQNGDAKAPLTIGKSKETELR